MFNICETFFFLKKKITDIAAVSPSHLFLFLYKAVFFCLLDLPVVFAIACLSRIAILCYCQIHFAGKIIGNFIFFRTIQKT